VSQDPNDFSTCDVCGRTILRGERLYEYVSRGHGRLSACSLCRTRAERSGWVPASLAGALAKEPPARRRRGVLRQRLGQAAERVRPPRGAIRERVERAAETLRPQPRESVRERAAEPPPPPPPRAIPKTADGVMRRALEDFNRSSGPRKVGALSRSLGAPQVSVLVPRPEEPRALVTVAWELSWYQWEVGIRSEGATVREVAKGDELSELPGEAQAWNASAAESGELQMAPA
jgi:hypothetical protein